MLTCIMQQVVLYVLLGFESTVLRAFEGITISFLINSYEKCSIFFFMNHLVSNNCKLFRSFSCKTLFHYLECFTSVIWSNTVCVIFYFMFNIFGRLEQNGLGYFLK